MNLNKISLVSAGASMNREIKLYNEVSIYCSELITKKYKHHFHLELLLSTGVYINISIVFTGLFDLQMK